MIKKILIALFVVVSLSAPMVALAWTPSQPIMDPKKCEYGKPFPPEIVNGELKSSGEKECGFGDFVKLLKDLVDVMFYFSIPIVAGVFSYAGYLYLTAMGNSGQVSKANKIFTGVLMGFIFMLSGWLIVRLLYVGLVKDSDLFKDREMPIKIGD